MNDLKFIKLENSKEHEKFFCEIMLPYCKELDKNAGRNTPEKTLINFAKSIVKLSENKDRFVELCYDNNVLIGFLYGKIDRNGDMGYVRADWGYVMEFYVKPEYRRNGYGKAMYQRLENLFVSNDVTDIWLTADPVTGEPFWQSLGFKNSGVQSPENNLYIYEKHTEEQQ